jgi:hypothetical protein
MVNATHLGVPAGFHASQLDLYVIYRVSEKCRFSYNYFVTGEDNKANFSIHDDTLSKEEVRWFMCCTYIYI